MLEDRGVTKRVLGIKDTITHLHRFVEFEAPHQKRRSGVVAHEKGYLETTVIEGRVRHKLTFPRKMPNAIAAKRVQASVEVNRDLTFRAFPRRPSRKGTAIFFFLRMIKAIIIHTCPGFRAI